ncbi:MAG: HIT domain-containing protein [Acidobacteriota bacterium]
MDRLFTPWRLDYLTSTRSEETCVFCGVFQTRKDADAYLLARGEGSFVILNLFPYANGHLLVVANRHVGRLSDLTKEERQQMMETVTRCEKVLRAAYQPDGMNLGLNMGKAAGAGIIGHLHIHLVPRWSGDTNFATVIGETRIIPETPSQTYERLLPFFAPNGAASQS